MNRNKIIIKTSIKGILVNILLVAFKIIVGLFSNSIAIILDAINNLSDALSSIITIIGTKLASKKADKKHPYGYGRIEYLTSIIISVIVLFAGITSFRESLSKIINPEKTNYTFIMLIIIGIAIIVKYFFGIYVKKVGEKINSTSLVASGTDAYMDSFLSLSTLIAAIVSIIFHISIEGYIGILISTIIIKSAVEMLIDAINPIIGERADQDLIIKLKKVINSFNEVEGCYDLTLHNYGPTDIIGSVHIQVDDNMKAKEIHALTKKIQAKVMSDFGVIITVGIYASNNSKKEYQIIKDDLNKISKKYSNIKQIHGFYVDSKTNIITFDMIFDYDTSNSEIIKEEIIKELKSKYPKYEYYIVIDNDFSD